MPRLPSERIHLDAPASVSGGGIDMSALKPVRPVRTAESLRASARASPTPSSYARRAA
jgi:hypothetical protein